LTIAEIIIALLVGIVVAGLVVTLLSRAVVTVWRSEERLDPRERAHMALTVVRRELIDSWHYALTPGGAGLAFHGPRRSGELSHDAQRRRQRLRPAGQERAFDLISSDVDGFTLPALRPGYLRLTLRIARPERGGPMQSLGALEVSEEIFMPCIALRDPSIPWNRALEHRTALEPSR
jgi:hypothetical protein